MDSYDEDLAGLESRILELVAQAGYRPAKARRIAVQLGLEDDRVADVKRIVKRLVKQGRLAYEARHLIRLPGAAVAESAGAGSAARGPLVGTFRRIQAGGGFVRLRSDSAGGPAPEDVFVPPDATADASTGDVVAVRLSSKRGRAGAPQGRVIEIVERESHDFVGTYFESRGAGWVRVDGNVFAQPVFVGDAGAKGAQTDDKVVIEMVRFPTHLRDGEAVITEVLGGAGQPGVDTLSVMREFHLPDDFPQAALDDARQQAERFTEEVPAGRLDLTRETVITIDPVDARDFDDAISLDRLEDGGWRLGVHIADVAHFVPVGGGLDREARQRGTSVYLPDRVLPMLPEIVSNGLASLQPGKVRFTKTAFLEFTDEGLCTHAEFHNSAIQSSKRLTYEQVDAFLGDPAAHRKWGVKIGDLLARMRTLAATLRRRRFARGALELSLRDVQVDLDRRGQVVGAHVELNTESHQMIEEFMLSANEAVAEFLAEKGLVFLRRVHKAPSEHKMRLLTEFVRELGFAVPNLEDRFAMQRLLADVADKPEQHAVNYALLRSLQRAVYSPAEEGHYALASECYCHFTSPIRRYPDLTIHRMLEAVLAHRKPKQDRLELVKLAEHCSEQEQRAEAAERELTRLKLLAYLSQRIGDEMDALVTGVESFGLFVQGIDLPAEGLVPVASLNDDFYQYDRAAHTLSGRRAGNTFRLGDRVRVTVARVDLQRRELDFYLVGHQARPAQGGKKRGGRKPPRKARPPKRPKRKGRRK